MLPPLVAARVGNVMRAADTAKAAIATAEVAIAVAERHGATARELFELRELLTKIRESV